jgi:hypothetical protein
LAGGEPLPLLEPSRWPVAITPNLMPAGRRRGRRGVQDADSRAVTVRDGLLVEHEPKHGGAPGAGARGAGSRLLRHRRARQATRPVPPRAQRLRLRHPLRRHLRRPPPQGPGPVPPLPPPFLFPPPLIDA